jgi:hypothetical protein
MDGAVIELEGKNAVALYELHGKSPDGVGGDFDRRQIVETRAEERPF